MAFFSFDDITFEVEEVVAKQSITIKHTIEDSLASRGPILLPKVPGDILAKVIEYCKHVVTQPLASDNHVDLKAFVSKLVKDSKETVFGLLVAADYLNINGLLSLACEDVLDMIKHKDPEHMCRIFTSAVKVFLQSIDGKTFEVDEAVAKQSVMIEHLIKDKLTRTGLVIIPNVSGDVLAKIVDYCKCVVIKPPSGENDVELRAFVSELVNDDEETVFGLLVAVYYLDIKGLLSLACENVLDMIKRNDPAHICRIFDISANPWAFNLVTVREKPQTHKRGH
ncbi:hypothetical protein M9H77_17087 [Catharanthus roseus]|uniref:Uncharacterized protein n=1 Tax=Catharanthus roseus TaxID=4058 RepID=A0ACC0B3L2_CATRO|nr:hypothetical protein M9H77_17087 [Catharanthus roseus]